MRLPLSEFLQKLGVSYLLGSYETCPWSVTDNGSGKTCSAEVRMSPDSEEIEAELQIFYEQPEPGKPPVEQILWLKALPHQTKWDVVDLRIRREDWRGKMYGWEEKCCNFFRACVIELDQGRIPDIDGLLEKEMKENERFSGGKGGGGKSPKIKPAQLLQMKQSNGM
ncbi:MAG: hypothetical protein JNL76_04965 [Alphaproteobacteria bacterium]|mgnify:CR=1 FL=1|nr:hypothetical protein [Alphaproteobacteria bacterium]